MTDHSLKLLEPPPQERLAGWLSELYGKQVEITRSEVLRHRDLSYVVRLVLKSAIPESLIYKVVLPPWEIEQDLHEHVLIPAVSNSARLYLSGHWQGLTALFLEDLGNISLLGSNLSEAPMQVGTELAKLHRAFTYRIDEVRHAGVLRTILPADYETIACELSLLLHDWQLAPYRNGLSELGKLLSQRLAAEPVSLVHGDMYAENILLSGGRLYFIDWSWFTTIGVALMDLATLTSKHHKNGALFDDREQVIDAYCQEFSRNRSQVDERLPAAEALSRLLFLQWLVERRRRGILGTTVGPVDDLISRLAGELAEWRQRLV